MATDSTPDEQGAGGADGGDTPLTPRVSCRIRSWLGLGGLELGWWRSSTRSMISASSGAEPSASASALEGRLGGQQRLGGGPQRRPGRPRPGGG